MPNVSFLKYWKNGGMWDHWVHDAATVGAFIKQHQLHPLKQEEALARKGVHEAAATLAPELIPRIGYAGGMKAPHLHFHGEIYSLNRGQWREFAEATLKDLRQRLDEVKSVGFDQLMELSEAVNAVT